MPSAQTTRVCERAGTVIENRWPREKMLYTVTHAFDCANIVHVLGVMLHSNIFACIFVK